MNLEKELVVTKKLASSGAFEVTIGSKDVADKIRDEVDAMTKEALGHDVCLIQTCRRFEISIEG